MEAMGFREVVSQGAIVASFMSVTVFEARGITLPDGFAQALKAQVAGADYRIALGQSVNAGCRVLTGDDFVDSETEWRKRVNTNGPFLLVAVGPTAFVECSDGRLMRHEDGSITTYDSFPHMRDALRKLEDRVLPPVLAAATCALCDSDHYVTLRRLERAASARCSDGTPLHDIRIDVKAEGFVSRSFDETGLNSRLSDVAKKAPSLNQRASRFFALGLGEKDQLKRFLYFFLSLEVETYAVFGRIDHHAQTAQLLAAGTSPATPTLNLVGSQVAALTNLFDRFVWCAACSWTGLTDTDISLFKALKNARDAIAHGRASEPPSGYALSAELLARKILWS